MNWYKQSQKENWSWTKFVTVFGITLIAGLASLKGMGILEIQKEFEQNPQKVIQEVQQVSQEQPVFQNIEEQPQRIEQPVKERQDINIDLDKIWQIESTRGADPKMKKPNSSGALGHFQFSRKTWDECVGKMGKNWDWWNGALNYDKSKQVADFYLNKRIPQMLRYYKIPDTIRTRIACYSWGIGNLKKLYEMHQSVGDLDDLFDRYAPQETLDYFEKYGV